MTNARRSVLRLAVLCVEITDTGGGNACFLLELRQEHLQLTVSVSVVQTLRADRQHVAKENCQTEGM